jgi:hypothetical protein
VHQARRTGRARAMGIAGTAPWRSIVTHDFHKRTASAHALWSPRLPCIRMQSEDSSNDSEAAILLLGRDLLVCRGSPESMDIVASMTSSMIGMQHFGGWLDDEKYAIIQPCQRPRARAAERSQGRALRDVLVDAQLPESTIGYAKWCSLRALAFPGRLEPEATAAPIGLPLGGLNGPLTLEFKGNTKRTYQVRHPLHHPCARHQNGTCCGVDYRFNLKFV